MGGDNSKPWSVSATLRGFYDDNYATASNDSGNKHGSFGMSISPSVAFKFPMDQTTLGFRYTYGASWYQERTRLSSDNSAWDQSHNFEGMLSHSFNERFSVDVMDSFVISQEPGLIDATGVNTFPYRTAGDNIRNHGEITFNGALTRQLSFVAGYQNTFYDYENKSPLGGANAPGGIVDTSLSGLLDRMEHEALFNLRWQALPQTVLIGGYNYRQVNYTSDEYVANAGVMLDANNLPVNDLRRAETRDSRSHIFYGGFDQNFSKDLIFTLRAGVQLTEYPNAPANEPNDSSTSPWGSVNLTYVYLPGSSVQVGYRYARNQTDVVAPYSDVTTNYMNSITSDQETGVLFALINHSFSPKLTGRLTAQWQASTFYGGLYDGKNEDFFDLGGNLTYRFNQHFSGELGYNYSQLTSDIVGRDYDRNYVYLGVTATY